MNQLDEVDKEGFYHVRVINCEMKEGGGELSSFVEIVLHVLAGEHDDQVDKVIRHRIHFKICMSKNQIRKPLYKKQEAKITAFAIAFGLIDLNQLGQLKAMVPFHLIYGKQAVVKVCRRELHTNDRMNMAVHGPVFEISDSWPLSHERFRRTRIET